MALSAALRLALLYALSITLARADSLTDILKRMDAAASQFKSMSARTKSTEYTKLVDHADEEYATLRMRRTRNGPDAVWEFSGKDPRVISVSGHLASRYFPRANTEERYNAANYVSLIQESLLLGFGSPVADLRKVYDIQFGGADAVGSQHTTWVRFTPKVKSLTDLFTKIDLWFPDGGSSPVQEKIWTGTRGDYTLVTYLDLQINPPLPDSAFQFKSPPRTNVINVK